MSGPFGGWAVVLNGVATTYACDDPQALWDQLDCFDLSVFNVMDRPPEGVGGLPGIRNEDVTYYQRDGVKPFSDWYGPRDIVITGTISATTLDCEGDPDPLAVPRKVNEFIQAWKRSRTDTEIVIYPPRDAGDDVDRILTGPFGLVGRPRGVIGGYLPHDQEIYEFTARFQVNDQRLFILDECGTPGYEECVSIDPGTQLFTLCGAEGTGDYAGTVVLCGTPEGVCATGEDSSGDSVDPTPVSVGGTEQVYPTITLYPPLATPYVENVNTGEYVSLDTTLVDGDTPVTINPQTGTAFDAEGNSLTHLLRGSLFLTLYPGNYEFRLLSGTPDDEGYATLCWRPTVVNS